MFDKHRHGEHGRHGGLRRFSRDHHGHGPGHHGHGPHEQHGHGRHGRRGGRSALGRFFAHGDLRLVVLHLVSEKPRHGYEIIKEIEERVAGAYSPSPGVVYPTLTMLEDLGYVTVTTSEGGKKLHAITEQGRSFLDANRANLDAMLARIADVGRDAARDAHGRISEAMDRLKVAVRLRMSPPGIDAAQAEAIVAAIDEAAARIGTP